MIRASWSMIKVIKKKSISLLNISSLILIMLRNHYIKLIHMGKKESLLLSQETEVVFLNKNLNLKNYLLSTEAKNLNWFHNNF